MTESCLSCGNPLAESERAGLMCAACASEAGNNPRSGRGLRLGDGWGASNQHPIGAIGGPTRPDADSANGRPHDGVDGEPDYTSARYSYPRLEQPEQQYDDPDRAPWGLGAAIGVWLASVAAILIFPNIAVLAWLVYERLHGLVIPAGREQLEKLLAQPRVALIVVLSSIAAHLVTLAIVWAVVSGLGRRSILHAPEWSWKGPNKLVKILFVAGVVVLMLMLEVLLSGILPESKETEFDRLLKTSADVRVVVALLAVFTAPLVEEWVYRGVLYAGLRRVAGVWPSVLVVAILFAGVHFPQYWGAWAGLISITVLSLTLTIIRAKTRSILPCIAVHVLFNAVTSVAILLHHY